MTGKEKEYLNWLVDDLSERIVDADNPDVEDWLIKVRNWLTTSKKDADARMYKVTIEVDESDDGEEAEFAIVAEGYFGTDEEILSVDDLLVLADEIRSSNLFGVYPIDYKRLQDR